MCSAKILSKSSGEARNLQRYGQPKRVRILISKGSRADMLLEVSNTQQREPQWADLNLHANLPAICHAPCSFTVWARAASLAGNRVAQCNIHIDLAT